MRQKAHLIPTIVNETPIDCDADEAIHCLEKLSINSSDKKVTNPAENIVIDLDPEETGDKNTSASESTTSKNQTHSCQHELNLSLNPKISQYATTTINSMTSSNNQTTANSHVVSGTDSLVAQANKSSYRNSSEVQLAPVTTQAIVTIQPTRTAAAHELNNSQNIQIIPISIPTSQQFSEHRNGQPINAEIALTPTVGPPSYDNRNDSINAINITPIQSTERPHIVGIIRSGQRFAISIQPTASTTNTPSYANNFRNEQSNAMMYGRPNTYFNTPIASTSTCPPSSSVRNDPPNAMPVSSAATMGQLQQIVNNFRYDQTNAMSSHAIASTSTNPPPYVNNSRNEQTKTFNNSSTAAPVNNNMRIEQTSNMSTPSMLAANHFPFDNNVRYGQLSSSNTSTSTPPRPQSADSRAGPSNHFRLPSNPPRRSLSVERASNDHQPAFEVRPMNSSRLLESVLRRPQSLDRTAHDPISMLIRSDFAEMLNNQEENNNLSALSVWRSSAREGL